MGPGARDWMHMRAPASGECANLAVAATAAAVDLYQLGPASGRSSDVASTGSKQKGVKLIVDGTTDVYVLFAKDYATASALSDTQATAVDGSGNLTSQATACFLLKAGVDYEPFRVTADTRFLGFKTAAGTSKLRAHPVQL